MEKLVLIRAGVAGVGLLVLAGASWLSFHVPGDRDGAPATRQQTVVVRPAGGTMTPEPPAPNRSTSAGAVPVAPAGTGAATAGGAGGSVPSVEPRPPEALPVEAPRGGAGDPDVAPASHVDLALDQRDLDAGAGSSAAPGIAVPTSGPAGEAAMYSASRQERGFGNLDAPPPPPPLDLPGGPDDPTGDRFAPPPAPGG